MKKLRYILVFLVCIKYLDAQDTIKSIDYFKLTKKTKSYFIKDDFKNIYKEFDKKKNKEFVLVENKMIEITKTFYLDKTFNSDDKHVTENEGLLLSYYQKNIFAPRHGGDPNQTTISFVISNTGQILKISVLENVKNVCVSSKWDIKLDKNFKFKTLKCYPKNCLIEYVLKLDAICYCACDELDEDKH